MTFNLGSNIIAARIPVLWGNRAIFVHEDQSLSVVHLSSDKKKIEVLKNKPAEGCIYTPIENGFVIRVGNGELYQFSTSDDGTVIAPIDLSLPAIVIKGDLMTVGGITLSGNSINAEVGIICSEDGYVTIGARIPDEYRKLLGSS